MNSLDYGIVGLTIGILVLGLLALLLISLAVRRAIITMTFGILGRNKNVILARVSLLFIIIGLGFGLAFWLGAWASLDIAKQSLISAILTSVGVILTGLIKLPRTNKDESLSTKIVQHAYVAWPWRHKWIIIPALIFIVTAGILIYQAIKN